VKWAIGGEGGGQLPHAVPTRQCARHAHRHAPCSNRPPKSRQSHDSPRSSLRRSTNSGEGGSYSTALDVHHINMVAGPNTTARTHAPVETGEERAAVAGCGERSRGGLLCNVVGCARERESTVCISLRVPVKCRAQFCRPQGFWLFSGKTQRPAAESAV